MAAKSTKPRVVCCVTCRHEAETEMALFVRLDTFARALFDAKLNNIAPDFPFHITVNGVERVLTLAEIRAELEAANGGK